MGISTLVWSFWSKRERLGWSGARVMTVLNFASLFELLRPREAIRKLLLAVCGHFGPNQSFWDGLELEL